MQDAAQNNTPGKAKEQMTRNEEALVERALARRFRGARRALRPR